MHSGDGTFDAVMFVDVLHHRQDPMILLREGSRVAPRTILIEDHTLTGVFRPVTLCFMENAGNIRHHWSLPSELLAVMLAFEYTRIAVCGVARKTGLHPWPASWLFDR